MNIVGLDIGHSAVKVVASFDGKRTDFLFPSVVVKAFPISDEAEASRAARDLVRVGGQDWFTGETAAIQGGGDAISGLSDNWIESIQHDALFLSAIKRLEARGFKITSSTMIVLGLPANLYGQQKDKLKVSCSQYVQAEYKVVPQPMGPYQAMMLGPDGLPVKERSMEGESWGVVEVGHYTTDFMLSKGGRWIEKASGSCAGMRVAVDALQRLMLADSINADHLECQEILRTRKFNNFGRVIDATQYVRHAARVLVDGVVDNAERLIAEHARRLNGVIVAGGGADFIIETLQERWPHAIIAKDPRMAVAEGFCRLGLGISHARKFQAETAAA